jgi:hypothetical protein
VREHMAKAYTFLASDVLLPLPLEHRDMYARASLEAQEDRPQ